MSRPAGESDEDEFDDDDFEIGGYDRPNRVVVRLPPRKLSPNEKLFKAVGDNDVSAAESAIDEGADLHTRVAGMSAIMEAAYQGRYEVMELLIRKGANVNDEEAMTSVMMWLCKSCSRNENELLRCFRLLIDNGANPLATDWLSCTSLIHAVRSNHSSLVTPLIESGCDVNADDCEGNTPIAFAVDKENLDMVRLLIANGARTDATDRRGERLIDKPQVHTNIALAALLGFTPEEEEEVEKIRRPFLSLFKLVMLDLPDLNDRLQGYHTDAVRLVRAIASHDIAKNLDGEKIQLGHVLTWNNEEWKESGVRFSFYLKKIALNVKKYHERPWGRKAIPEASKIVCGNEVDPFPMVLFLLDFLRVMHISSATSLYMLKNPGTEDRKKTIAGVKQVLMLNSLAKKQLHSIRRVCAAIDAASSAPPDLISCVSHKPNLTAKLLAYRVFLALVFFNLGVSFEEW